jgi:hypothetical protein
MGNFIDRFLAGNLHQRRISMKRFVLLSLAAVIIMGLVAVSADAPAAKDNETGDAPRIPKKELKAMLGDPNLVIIDSLVGDQWETVNQKLPGAVHEDPDNVDAWADKYPKDKILVTYCA